MPIYDPWFENINDLTLTFPYQSSPWGLCLPFLFPYLPPLFHPVSNEHPGWILGLNLPAWSIDRLWTYCSQKLHGKALRFLDLTRFKVSGVGRCYAVAEFGVPFSLPSHPSEWGVDDTLPTSQNTRALRVHFQLPGRGDVILDSLLLTVSMVIDSEYKFSP